MYVVQLLDSRLRSFSMAQNPSDQATLNDPSIDAQTSVLVLLSARAISSLGFAVSLLVIWFGWLLPTSLMAPPPSDISEIRKPRPVPKHQRRSVSSPVQRSSASIDLAPILVPHPGENHSSRRVSFADTSISSATRRNTMPEPNKSNISLSPPHSATPIAIPRRPSPNLRPGTSPNGCLDDLHAHDSDSSRPSRLQKLKFGFNLKTHRQPLTDKQSDRDSITSIESTTSEKTTKRNSGGFVAAWSNSRSFTVGIENDPAFASSSSRLSFVRLLSPTTPALCAPSSPGLADMESPTSSSRARKAERRGSMPIPRTRPYGAPYFASPPVLLDKKGYPGYLKALPQFEDETQFSSARASERGREPATGKQSLYPSRRAIPKRRSASEDWTVRSPINS